MVMGGQKEVSKGWPYPKVELFFHDSTDKNMVKALNSFSKVQVEAGYNIAMGLAVNSNC
jgi:hypothetical protein